MAKHIIGQSIFQSIVMFIIYFSGTKFLPAELDDAQKQGMLFENLNVSSG
jgi:hypothetical protein